MSLHREMGREALSDGDARTAIMHLEQACAADPADIPALRLIGKAYTRAGRLRDAVEAYTRVVLLEPGSSLSRFELALAYKKAGFLQQAVTAASQAIELDPTNRSAAELLGEVQTALGAAEPHVTITADVTQPFPLYPGAPARERPATYQFTPAVYLADPAYDDTFDLRQGFRDIPRVIRSPNVFFREQAGRTGFNAPISFLVAYGIATAVLSILELGIRSLFHADFGADAAITAVGTIVGAGFGIAYTVAFAFVWAGILHVASRPFGNRGEFAGTFRVAAYSMAPFLIVRLLVSIASVPVAPASMSPLSSFAPSFQSGAASGRSVGSPNESTSARAKSPGANPDSSAMNILHEVLNQVGMGALLQWLLALILLSLAGAMWVYSLQAVGMRYTQNLSPGAAVGSVLLAIFGPILIFAAIVAIFVLIIMAITRHMG